MKEEIIQDINEIIILIENILEEVDIEHRNSYIFTTRVNRVLLRLDLIVELRDNKVLQDACKPLREKAVTYGVGNSLNIQEKKNYISSILKVLKNIVERDCDC
jgi:hypothetical protein